MHYVVGVVSKKAPPYPRSSRFSPMLSSRSFIVLCFTFRSMIHFELIFVKGIRSVSRFIFFCMWMSSCSSTIYGRDYFAQLYCLCSYSKDQLTIWGSISGLSSLFHLSIFLFFSFIHQYHTVLITAAL